MKNYKLRDLKFNVWVKSLQPVFSLTVLNLMSQFPRANAGLYRCSSGDQRPQNWIDLPICETFTVLKLLKAIFSPMSVFRAFSLEESFHRIKCTVPSNKVYRSKNVITEDIILWTMKLSQLSDCFQCSWLQSLLDNFKYVTYNVKIKHAISAYFQVHVPKNNVFFFHFPGSAALFISLLS